VPVCYVVCMMKWLTRVIVLYILKNIKNRVFSVAVLVKSSVFILPPSFYLKNMKSMVPCEIANKHIFIVSNYAVIRPQFLNFADFT
jgi:hypothetical protein